MQWSRPSVQMVQVRLSAKLCFLFGLFPIILAAGPLQPRKVFCSKRISSNFTPRPSPESATVGLYLHCACIAYQGMKHLENSITQRKSQNDRPSPPHTRSAETPGFPLEFVKLRVSLFRWNRVDPALTVSYPYYGSC